MILLRCQVPFQTCVEIDKEDSLSSGDGGAPTVATATPLAFVIFISASSPLLSPSTIGCFAFAGAPACWDLAGADVCTAAGILVVASLPPGSAVQHAVCCRGVMRSDERIGFGNGMSENSMVLFPATEPKSK